MANPVRALQSLGSADRLRLIGDESRDRGNWAEAANAYTKFLQRNPTDFAIWVQLGNCSKEAGRFVAAEQAYRSAIALHERDSDVWLQLGHLCKLLGRRPDAAKAYEAVLLLQPDHMDAREELASLLGNRPAMSPAFDPLGTAAESLDALSAMLKANATRSDIFRRYFNEFMPK